MLMRRWERARLGDGQLALIVGESLGKSRLIEEFHSLEVLRALPRAVDFPVRAVARFFLRTMIAACSPERHKGSVLAEPRRRQGSCI
jgi:hypothetical protein